MDPPNTKLITIDDFSAGWNTVKGLLALDRNETPDILNLLHLPGALRFRGGMFQFSAVPFAADAAYPFYDTDHNKHFAIWAGGNLYDCAGGIATLIATAVYTAGSRVGHVAIQGVLYWSSASSTPPVPLRQWNPATATEAAVVSAGGAGVAEPPASDFLFNYLDSIVALAPFWGAPLVTPLSQSNVMCWCDTRDPTTWVFTNSETVGPTNGGTVVFGAQFGIADIGVAPFRNIIVGRDDEGLYAYSGALGALVQSVLNCPVGCEDPATVQYLPTAGAFGVLAFLGTDGQAWATNGINAFTISDQIFPTLVPAVALAKANNADIRFTSGYNQQWQYYWIDVGGVQYVYRWTTKSWTRFSGWATGPTFSATGLNGAPAIFIASNSDASPMLVQVGVDGFDDNGVMPSVYYKSPWLHGGDLKLYKDFQGVAIGSLDTGGMYDVVGRGNKRLDGSQMVSNPAQFTTPNTSAGGNPFIWGSSLWGGTDVWTAVEGAGLNQPVIMQSVLQCAVAASKFMPEGETETLKAQAVQLTITQAGGLPYCDILGIEVGYVPLGYMGAGLQYNPTAGGDGAFDPFVAPE